MAEIMWHPWFAWFPVRVESGAVVWMRWVERGWDNDINPWGAYGYSGTDGGYIYRKPQKVR